MELEYRSNSHRAVYISILLFGVVSLLGDIVYEGSRGIVPYYLQFLGATALVVGVVGGLGDFLGYAFRLVSGVLTDATRSYWAFIFLGYGLVIAVPMLGLTGGLEAAISLVLLERFGKALRSPSRDAVLSVISRDVGAGKAFGLHELMDQVGAVLGPSIVAVLMFSTGNDFRFTLSFLFLPFAGLMAALTYAYTKTKDKAVIETAKKKTEEGCIRRPFYLYTLAVMLNTIGLIPFSLILFRASEIVRPLNMDWVVPLIYVLIQGVDAPTALISGYAYDRFGIGVLALPFVLSLFPPLFAMAGGTLMMLVAASVFFGLVLGMQESIYRAAVSTLTPIASRGTAYGIFNTTYGVGFLISGALYGAILTLEFSYVIIAVYVAMMQAAAVALLLIARSALKKRES